MEKKIDSKRLFNTAKWISPSYPAASPIIQKTFILDTVPKSAKLYITGLGYFESKINGENVTNDRLIPPASDYLRRTFKKVTYPVTDEFTHRIYYHIFDVSYLLQKGKNELTVQLGGGWFVQKERIAEGEMSYSDAPICIFVLDVDGRKIYSTGEETFTESEIRYSNIFIGEEIDATYKDDFSKPVNICKAPDSILSEAMGINDGFVRKIIPRVVFKSKERQVYDLGENVSALVTIVSDAPFGSRFVLNFSENISEDFSLDFTSTGIGSSGSSGNLQLMHDVFITNGIKREYTPKFVWHAFRYFEVIGECGFICDIFANVIHANVEITSHFDSDSEGMNFLYDAYIRTQLSNYHGSFPSDCPHRERLGYTGDGQICAATAMLTLNSKELYRKWIRDILDCQDIKSGHVQHTAPFQGGGGGPGGWGAAIIKVPYEYYKAYGEDEILKEALPQMRRFIDFTAKSMENGLVVKEIDGGWCLGDWCSLESGKLPPAFVNTCLFIQALKLYGFMIESIGLKKEEELIKLEQEAIRAAKNAYDSLSSIGSAMVYAAWIGIDENAKFEEYYKKLSHFDTGFIGTDILSEIIFKKGNANLFYELLSSEDIGTYLYMKRNGATTLWEQWHGEGSHSHPMFGGSVRQLFSGILGIRQEHDSVAYERVIINPALPDKMNFASGGIATVKGKISVMLQRKEYGIEATVTIPKNVKASFSGKETVFNVIRY